MKRSSRQLLGPGFVFCAAVALSLAATESRADGLLYQLPEDGSTITFNLEMTGEGAGTLVMSSVGKKDVEGQPCRWIEVQMTMKRGGEDRVIIAKALMPEKELKKGGRPWDNFKAAWLKMGDGEPEEIKEVVGNRAGPLPAFLSGPLANEQPLPAASVDSGLGILNCAGVTGDIALQDGQSKVSITLENRLNEKAPFGVVTAKLSFRVERDGEQREQGVISLKAVSAGKGATSALPDIK